MSSRWMHAPCALVALALLATAVPAASPPAARLRIGTYDSRVVALAYYRSPRGQQLVERLRADLAQARQAKDEKQIAALEREGPALQNLMHQQVFGDLSIPNVLAAVSDSLPAVASRAGVSLLVSKWELRGASTDAELVDVTPQMVALFAVDGATRQMLEESMKHPQPPIAVERLLDPME